MICLFSGSGALRVAAGLGSTAGSVAAPAALCAGTPPFLLQSAGCCQVSPLLCFCCAQSAGLLAWCCGVQVPLGWQLQRRTKPLALACGEKAPRPGVMVKRQVRRFFGYWILDKRVAEFTTFENFVKLSRKFVKYWKYYRGVYIQDSIQKPG